MYNEPDVREMPERFKRVPYEITARNTTKRALARVPSERAVCVESGQAQIPERKRDDNERMRERHDADAPE